jgi:hypothetical protein
VSRNVSLNIMISTEGQKLIPPWLEPILQLQVTMPVLLNPTT